MKKVIVLDLDETLVHSSYEQTECDNIIIDQDKKIYVSLRPHLDQFLLKLHKQFHLYIWTAGNEQYANIIRNIIDPNNVYIKEIYSRDDCFKIDKMYVKDLELLSIPLDKVVLIDNNFNSAYFQENNIMICSSYYDDKNDEELLYLLEHISQYHQNFYEMCFRWNYDV